MNTDIQYYQYLFGSYYYATFLRLRRECRIRNLFETGRNLDNSYQHRMQFDLVQTSSKF
jgi:hypothetical protein